MEDKAIKIFSFLRDLTKTRGGILILGIIIALTPCVYVIHFQHFKIEELKAEISEAKKNDANDPSDCIERLLIQERKMDELKQYIINKNTSK